MGHQNQFLTLTIPRGTWCAQNTARKQAIKQTIYQVNLIKWFKGQNDREPVCDLHEIHMLQWSICTKLKRNRLGLNSVTELSNLKVMEMSCWSGTTGEMNRKYFIFSNDSIQWSWLVTIHVISTCQNSYLHVIYVKTSITASLSVCDWILIKFS